MDKLFSNIESKLKILAKVTFVCGFIAGIFYTVVLFDDWGFMPILSITVGLLWVLAGLISSWGIYATAELLENIKEMNRTLKVGCTENFIKKAKQQTKQERVMQDEDARPKEEETVRKTKEQHQVDDSKLTRISEYWDQHPEELQALAEKRAEAKEKLSKISALAPEQKQQLRDLIQAIDDELNKDRGN